LQHDSQQAGRDSATGSPVNPALRAVRGAEWLTMENDRRTIGIDSPAALVNRELSWLNFAGRVLAQVGDSRLPLLERVKFAGIMGMLHDEFFMKRVGGLKKQLKRAPDEPGDDGKTAGQVLAACREVMLQQVEELRKLIPREILPALREHGIPILDYSELNEGQRGELCHYFEQSVLPVLTPLAVDDEHPFPFISNLGLNLGVQVKDSKKTAKRFVRIKVPDNRPRWVKLEDGSGFIPLEQVIAGNLDLLFPGVKSVEPYFFRVTRGADGDQIEQRELFDDEMPTNPGNLLRQVSGSLKARRFAGAVRLQVSDNMPEKIQRWLTSQVGLEEDDVYPITHFMGINDLLKFNPLAPEELRVPPHQPATHRRLRKLDFTSSRSIFDEIRRGDILLHHPYHSFDTSVLHFIQSAAVDPLVLGIKLTIYRTSSDSPIILALIDAARRGKQVAVMVEITARFDEAPNIEWGDLLEREGVHVAYGVEKLKTHVKLALVIREEQGAIRRYVHIGTGNYHTGTARIYEDLGMLTCDPEIGADAAQVFNELTGSYSSYEYKKLLVAPSNMRERFTALIRREAEHAAAGKPSGIRAKMNQLHDPEIIRELYMASQAGVPVELNVRGLCCLRPGVPGLSETIRVFGVVGRFLEHGRIYRFENAGAPEYFIGSADWMRRNLDRRVESVVEVVDPGVARELDAILDVYERDNCSAWDCRPDGTYVRRRPADGEPRLAAQELFVRDLPADASDLDGED
jgi:polyphosphate kinase